MLLTERPKESLRALLPCNFKRKEKMGFCSWKQRERGSFPSFVTVTESKGERAGRKETEEGEIFCDSFCNKPTAGLTWKESRGDSFFGVLCCDQNWEKEEKRKEFLLFSALSREWEEKRGLLFFFS